MKKKMIFAASAVIMAAAVSAFAYIGSERNATEGLFSANVEALANAENGDLKKSIWWVNEKDPFAVICTIGGSDPCK